VSGVWCRQLESKHDAAAAYVDAALCFKKSQPLGENNSLMQCCVIVSVLYPCENI
jgi:hypothetical protein